MGYPPLIGAERSARKASPSVPAAAGTLGDAFRADLSAPINGGYPILRWQYVDPNATYTVTIRVEPADSVLTWNGERCV